MSRTSDASAGAGIPEHDDPLIDWVAELRPTAGPDVTPNRPLDAATAGGPGRHRSTEDQVEDDTALHTLEPRVRPIPDDAL